MNQPLKDINIWLTRPPGQAQTLTFLLKDKGANIFHLPMLEIENLPHDRKIEKQIKKLDEYDMVFFVSTNAAKIGMELVSEQFSSIPDRPKFFAPGPTTASVLENYGIKAAFPKKGMSTEAMLILPEIRQVLQDKKRKKKRALIFRGKGGRELLANTLRAKGVEVYYVELYRRVLPHYKTSYLEEILKSNKPDGIVFSSAEAMHNFTALFETVYPDFIKIPIFVSSPRLKNIASKIGFETIALLQAADDASVARGLGKANE